MIASPLSVKQDTAHIMARAAFSALDCGNFPLQTGDVQCAFEVWASKLEDDSRGNRLFAPFTSDRIARVRLNLICLGFGF